MLYQLLMEKYFLKLLRRFGLVSNRVLTFFKKETFSGGFLPFFQFLSALNKSLCTVSAFFIDKSFVCISLKNIVGNETLLKL